MTREEFKKRIESESKKKIELFILCESAGIAKDDTSLSTVTNCTYDEMKKSVGALQKEGCVEFKHYYYSCDSVCVSYSAPRIDATFIFSLIGDIDDNLNKISGGKCKVVKELKETSHIVCNI